MNRSESHFHVLSTDVDILPPVRFITGIGVGALSAAVPLYQSETVPRQIRGALVATYQLFITLGILVAYCINIGTRSLDNSGSWRIPSPSVSPSPQSSASASSFAQRALDGSWQTIVLTRPTRLLPSSAVPSL
ncbi:hypothetical protein L7F22_010089 [Adiantum nelumboides]|nr:hypothetical protein [Adiantum nelumboides]